MTELPVAVPVAVPATGEQHAAAVAEHSSSRRACCRIRTLIDPGLRLLPVEYRGAGRCGAAAGAVRLHMIPAVQGDPARGDPPAALSVSTYIAD
jgi:hypothetical protein